jgi:hypothetical protein
MARRTTCWETCGNGPATGTRINCLAQEPPGQHRERRERCGAGPGSLTRGTSAHRTVTVSFQATVTSISGFGAWGNKFPRFRPRHGRASATTAYRAATVTERFPSSEKTTPPKRGRPWRHHLHRPARVGFSRYLSWQFEQAVVITSAASRILSIFFDWAALYAVIPASRRP